MRNKLLCAKRLESCVKHCIFSDHSVFHRDFFLVVFFCVLRAAIIASCFERERARTHTLHFCMLQTVHLFGIKLLPSFSIEMRWREESIDSSNVKTKNTKKNKKEWKKENININDAIVSCWLNYAYTYHSIIVLKVWREKIVYSQFHGLNHPKDCYVVELLGMRFCLN